MSKWERDVALPDIATIPKLAELLGVSVEGGCRQRFLSRLLSGKRGES